MTTVRPFRCFDVRAISISLAIAAWLLLSSWISRAFALNSAPRMLLAASQAAALLLLIIALARSIARLDELERRIHHEALAAAGTTVVATIASWAFLEWAGLPRVDWSVFALPAFTIAWAAGVLMISRRYR